MAQWSALVSDVTARARGAGTGLVEEDASLLQGAIATALASNLEPETEITFKEFLDRTCQTSLATKVQQATALEWVSLQHACLTNSYLRSKLASNACSGCDKEVFHDIGLGCLVLKIVGKPGALKSKLYYRKPETGSPPARLALYFGGKASAVVWDSVMSGGGGAKNRILLKSGTQKEIEDNDQKWGLTLTPLPGMTTLQSSIWQPAWNVPACVGSTNPSSIKFRTCEIPIAMNKMVSRFFQWKLSKHSLQTEGIFIVNTALSFNHV